MNWTIRNNLGVKINEQVVVNNKGDVSFLSKIKIVPIEDSL